jgi:hypothetical protein
MPGARVWSVERFARGYGKNRVFRRPGERYNVSGDRAATGHPRFESGGSLAACEKLDTCPFFGDKMKSVPAVAEMMKKYYCQKEFARCARYKVSRSGIPVPGDLFPNEDDRAEQIIKSRGR